ncbi:hypothetical protein N658DRAFT_487010 [Parathielavia hyrcaniae]|uniref:Uncharacterized protein n=1 Tax=Parathielavia hyrcaniae TaxID=113614 RepID=A0AAN6Q3I7_9PEZI|nr:hypothetical protein N658DRAFT_487010 [Parathielavia hyrcaniae]
MVKMFNRIGSGDPVVEWTLRIAPFVCSSLAVMFMAIALSSGMEPNHLENLSIISFNTSGLGRTNLTAVLMERAEEKAAEACKNAGDKIDDFANSAAETVENAKDKAEDKAEEAVDFIKDNNPFGRRDFDFGGSLSDLCKGLVQKAKEIIKEVEDLVRSMARAAGIREHYSLHIGALCEGDFTDFRNQSAGINVTGCTTKFDHDEVPNFSKTLDQGLQVGGWNLSLSDVKFGKEVKGAFDLIPKALATMAYFFLAGVVSMAIALLLCGFLLGCPPESRLKKHALLGALGFMFLGWLISAIGVGGITWAAEKIKSEVNEHGSDFGISASTSPALYGLIWTSLVLSTLALALLGLAWKVNRRPRGLTAAPQQYVENNQSGSSTDSHGYKQMEAEGGQGQMKEVSL